jgi:hypothetical protein
LLSVDDPVDFQVILDEAALCRVVGSTEIMSAQLQHMLAVAQEPNITVQVIPFSRGAHAGMEGTFVILEYSEGVYHDLVFVENAVGGLFLEKDVDIDRYRTLFTILQQTALSAEQSLEMISSRAKELQ